MSPRPAQQRSGPAPQISMLALQPGASNQQAQWANLGCPLSIYGVNYIICDQLAASAQT